jgi:hypothetical protein
MVGKAQKSHGVRFGLYGGCSNGDPLSKLNTEFNSDLAPCDFWFFPTMKRSPAARNFEVINGAARFREEGGAL